MLWIVGTAIVLASWVDVVTPQVGWIGFAIGMVGYVLSKAAPESTTQPPKTQEEPADDGREFDEYKRE